MNQETRNNRQDNAAEDRRLEYLLEMCAPEPIDNTRIKNLVREKILREKMERQRKRRRFLWGGVSAAACLMAVVMLAVKPFARQPLDLSGASLAEAEKAGYREMVVAPGERAELLLPDGTKLVANACSRVLYPESFKGGERRIYARGEVYLEVAKDRKHPFVVESEGFDVRVLGTTFNICNSSDSTANVVLVEGSVEISTEKERNVRLTPDDMAELVNGDVASLKKVDTSDYTAWIKGILSLRGETLGSVAEKLKGHYGVDVSCDDALRDVKIYGKLDLEGDLDDAMEAISEIVPMRVVKDGNRLTMKSGK